MGYVAAPSICDRNAARSWSARGRLYAEAVLHGPTQAGHSGGYAPSCIGSHYAVRTAALREIGGLGPELAEDFTTTLMMSSHGWMGVFAVDAEAHGGGPETVADCMTQEFQWSRSMMNVLLGVSHHYRDGLSRAARIRLGFCQWWYPLFGTLMLASVLIPIIAIVTRTPFMRVSLGAFYAHFGPPTLVLLATVMWLRRLEWLRPRTARPISWEMALFQLVRWPWALFGCLHAIAAHIAGREFAFKVTPKGRSGAAPLPMRVVSPYLLLALVSATPALLGLNAGTAHGYYVLALINVALYMTAAVAILALHVYEHPRLLRMTVLRSCAGKLAATATSGAITLSAVLAPGLLVTTDVISAPGPAPFPVTASARGAIAIGVTTDALAKNSTSAWEAPALIQVNVFERAAHTHTGIVMWYADWQHARPELSQLRLVARRHSIPEISWEPWSYSGSAHSQRQYTLASIIRGGHDRYIRRFADTLRSYGGPVLLRFAQEMNGSWYPWSEAVNGNRPGEYVAAWRHVHDIFVAERATNVKWVWSPAAGWLAIKRSQYPGNAYVDVVGLSVFNGGTALKTWGGWRPFARIFNHSADVVRQMAPTKPMQISEVASAERGGNKAAWISRMFADLRRYPEVQALIWYDLRKQTNWPITSSTRAAHAFAEAVGVPRSASRPPLVRSSRS